MKLGIAIHGVSYVNFGVYCNHLKFIRSLPSEYEVVLLTVENSKVAQARNAIVKSAEEMEVDYLFFLDTDHHIPSDTLELLMQHMDKASIVSGVIHRRRGTYDVIGYVCENDKWYKVRFSLDGKVYSVDTCAFGITLISMKALKTLKKPYFEDEIKERKDGTTFQMRSDINLCRKLKDKGHKVMIDTRVIGGHVADAPIVYPTNSSLFIKENKRLYADVEDVNSMIRRTDEKSKKNLHNGMR